MIGAIVLGSTANAPTVVQMDDDGTYAASDDIYKPLAEYLNLTYSPTADRMAGDGASPFGYAALARAAKFAGMPARLARPVQPLPVGAVS